MPLLFAATLFVSASLLFMVQPMVGKMVLPLLGGSPAVWNACMVFFQGLLLLGYLYAHHLSGKFAARRQWLIHLFVLGLPLVAFLLAVTFGTRHSPIAIAESLAPGGDTSPILSVLLLLTVAIGLPFLVVSTSAPLLQKWFTCTGHPSARDPYFLYAASNLGSMISLLGYPLFIEPYLSIIGQAWLFAVGFAFLAAMIATCGYAAAHPIAVPPGISGLPTNKPMQKTGLQGGQRDNANHPLTPVITEPPPTLVRKAKWIALAFVPSSLMLGVTFHMTTDIASIPLLWVGPLALYLVTFIIAFGRVPDWFRVVIGNLAPVMILLLVFVLISGVNPGIGITLLLHLLTFFAAALMCHYELARDRPSPQYLTEFFLLMSVGGVLGGIFNSLVAPLVFPHAYEYPIVLILACLLVPRLLDVEDDVKAAGGSTTPVVATDAIMGATMNPFVYVVRLLFREIDKSKRLALILDVVIPILVGAAFYYLRQLPATDWFASMRDRLALNLTISAETIQVILIFAVPVMLCFFFVDRPVRFALCVAAILGYTTYKESARSAIHSERSFFGILKIEREVDHQRPYFKNADGKFVFSGEITYHRLVHGTTLHGTQIYKMENNVFDMFQTLTALNPLENLLVAGTNHAFDPRQEPLTYYHRTGPVGAMFHELRTRKGGADAKAHFAMVGLGTGSASCYAMPGQKITFYEIDPAVKHLVADMDEYFTYVSDARKRGAELDIRMGDARLKLKEDTDRKYALLLVDAFSSDSIPVHLLTRESVQLYLDRMTDDGILALHISNKFVRLEPVVAAIARDLGLTARVWNDDAEKRPGKTASSWVVLARTPDHLGDLYSPIGDLIFGPPASAGEDDRMRVSMDGQLFMGVLYDFDDELTAGKPKTKYAQLNEADDPRAAWLGWIEQKYPQVTDPATKARLELSAALITRFGPFATYQDAMNRTCGHAFRRLEIFSQVHAWTDDYSDVMRVMMIPELQWVRKLVGLPTPIRR